MFCGTAIRRAFVVVTLLLAAVASQSTARGAVYASLDAGADHTCAIRPGGAAYCWGAGQSGQLGVIGAGRARTPIAVIGSYTAVQLSSGVGYWCELLVGGKVSCTGTNAKGQLGTGDVSLAQYPHDVVGLPAATRVEAGRATTCALTSDGLYCWGDGGSGQFARSTLAFDPTPTPQKIPGVASGAIDLSVSTEHLCVVSADRRVSCWGDTTDGKLGNGAAGAIGLPGIPVPGITDAAAVAAGERHTCVLRENRTVWCWGNNQFGQLGAGPVASTGDPVQVQNLTDVVQISSQVSTTCAVQADGSVWCWGEGLVGQLGNGARLSSNVPVRVEGIADATAVSVGAVHTCAVTKTLAPSCWGSNRYGQLGSGGLLGSGVETKAQIVQDAVRGTAQFLPTPLAERNATSRGGKVYLRQLRLTRRGSKCPAKVDVTIRARGKEIVRTASDVEPVDGGCVVTALLNLPTKTARAFTVVVVVRGAKLKTRKVTLKARLS